MQKSSFIFLVIIILNVCFSACDQETHVSLPDISNIKADIEFIRYDQKLDSLDAERPSISYEKLIIEHPNITDLYFKKLIKLYDKNHDSFNLKLIEFIEDDRMNKLREIINNTYPDTKNVEVEIETACKYFKHYFPEHPLPRMYTLFTEFGYQTFIFSDNDGLDGIGIGLDMFLGDAFDYKAYNPTDPAFSDYLTRSYNKDHLAKKTMEILVEDVIGLPPGKRFIDQMIYQGKKLYILDKILPTHHDSIIHEYTNDQLSWVQNNELQIWDFFLEQEIMYDSDKMKLSRYLQPGPTSKGMPPESPGQTANYIGYRIVEAFMKRQPDIDMTALINYKDSQKLLEASRFKPARK